MSRGLVEILGSIFTGRRKSEENRHAVSINVSTDTDLATIYSRSPHAAILASVLTRQAAAAKKPSRESNDGAPISEKFGIGEALRKAREAVLSSGQELAKLCDKEVADYIRGLLSLVEDQHCRIAFVGQMNAGKSSLINAFIGAPRFLPTEITPWTTVVTNLYFGMPNLPTGGAVFEFFSPAEWQQLAEGSTRVRSLTEQLIPNFPWEDFYRQVGNMREKAQERLGPRYAELLGSQHTFTKGVTTGLLEKYIAAESPLGDAEASNPGEFSMITKAAHLYSDLGCFFFPTVVIDTPGVNDPFLVRDEITRQNLERANIFVIVVTARQLLSSADLDLLRILRGLNKDQIVIFINKIDEIDDFPAHSAMIMERIRGLLKREFPASHIPVVTGSALWAEIALGDDSDERQALARAFGRDRGPLSLAESSGGFWPSDPAVEYAWLTELILTRSGVQDLALAVSEILQRGGSASSIKYAAAVLAALARNGAARAQKLAILAARDLNGRGTEESSAGLPGRLDEAGDVLVKVEANIAEAAGKLKRLLIDHRAALTDGLRARIKACIASLSEESGPRGELAAFQLTSLVVRLRSELEQEFLRSFHETLGRITQEARDTERLLQERLNAAEGALGMMLDYALLPALRSAPSLAALGEPVATDLSLLRGPLGGQSQTSPQRVATMRNVIETGFESIAAKLVSAADEELQRTLSFILDHFRVTVSHTLRMIIDEQRILLSRLRGEHAIGSAELRRRSEAEYDEAKTYARLADNLGAIASLPWRDTGSAQASRNQPV